MDGVQDHYEYGSGYATDYNRNGIADHTESYGVDYNRNGVADHMENYYGPHPDD